MTDQAILSNRLRVFIEVEAGSREKNLYDEKTLEYKGLRQVARPYPYPYGFIIGTHGEDGDCVDCYLITRDHVKPGTMVECEPIGLLEQDEGDEIDHKVLAVIPGQHIEINQALQKELQDFIYAIFAEIPNTHVQVGDILPREAALEHIQKLREL